MKAAWITLLIPGVIAFTFIGCGKTDSASDDGESASSMAAGSIGGAAGAAESSTSGFAYTGPSPTPDAFQILKKFVQLMPNAWAATQCQYLKQVSCSGAVRTSTLTSCTFSGNDSDPVWNGSLIGTFDNATTCTNFGTATPTSGTLTRTFGSGTTRANAANSVTFAFDTGANLANWENTANIGGGQTVTYGASGRTIQINGFKGTASKSGTNFGDRTFSTTTDISVTGSGASRTVTAGAIRVQHNLAKFTGVSTIQTTLTFTAGCCFPTGGSTQTVLTGSKTGTETMTFLSTCGQATYVDNAGASSTITLRHCF